MHNTLLELHGQILASTEDDGLLQAEDRDALLRNSENVTFVIDQLLQVALLADYGDEIGRRKMFTLVRAYICFLTCWCCMPVLLSRTPTSGDMISDPNLPSSLISGCMDVLHKLSSHERDFQRVIVEIVQNVREDANAANETPDPEAMTEDDEEDDEAELLDLENATAEEIAADQRRRLEKAAKKMQNQTLDLEKKETYIRCLELVRALLERVDGVRRCFSAARKGDRPLTIVTHQVLSDNATLMGLVHDLIVPSVKAKEPEIRENGLLCLGLCCLLDKSYALDSFGLFVHQSQETNGELQIKIFKIIFDILMLYGVSFLTEKFEDHDVRPRLWLVRQSELMSRWFPREIRPSACSNSSFTHSTKTRWRFRQLQLSASPSSCCRAWSQTMRCVCFASLAYRYQVNALMTSVPYSLAKQVLKRLVLVYFAPETIDNLELRQCLSYFFPVYCYSQSANQKRMQEVSGLGSSHTGRELQLIFNELCGLDIPLVPGDSLCGARRLGRPFHDGLACSAGESAARLDGSTEGSVRIYCSYPGYTPADTRCSLHSAPEGVKVDETIQVDLTIDILKQIYKEPKKETRKQLCQLLGKLHIPDSLDEWQCKNVLLLISQLDSVSAFALSKRQGL